MLQTTEPLVFSQFALQYKAPGLPPALGVPNVGAGPSTEAQIAAQAVQLIALHEVVSTGESTSRSRIRLFDPELMIPRLIEDDRLWSGASAIRRQYHSRTTYDRFQAFLDQRSRKTLGISARCWIARSSKRVPTQTSFTDTSTAGGDSHSSETRRVGKTSVAHDVRRQRWRNLVTRTFIIRIAASRR